MTREKIQPLLDYPAVLGIALGVVVLCSTTGLRGVPLVRRTQCEAMRGRLNQC